MVYTVELTPEEEQRIRTAQALGIDVEQAIHNLIANLPHLEEPEKQLATDALMLGSLAGRFRNGAEILEYWNREDVRGTFTDRPDSPEYARQLRHEAETRRFD